MNRDGNFHRKPFTTIAFSLLILIGVLHAARIVYGWQVMIGSFTVPLWFSYLGTAFPVALALMLWRENMR